MYNKIAKRCVDFLKIMTNGNIKNTALLNMVNSKLTYLVSFKGAKFKQYTNSRELPLSYYGINFISSGASKDYTLNLFNDHLIPFIGDFLHNTIDEYKYFFEQEELKKISLLNGKEKKQAEIELHQKLNNFRYVNTETDDATILGIYKDASILNTIGKGSLFIRIGELGDYIDGVTSGNKLKKELFEKLKEMYDGRITVASIGGDNFRPTLRDISVNAFLYSDFENFKSQKNSEYFFKILKTGMARRSFIFMDELSLLNKPIDFKIKNEALTNASILSKDLEYIFENINNEAYCFDIDTSKAIDDYSRSCIDEYNKEVKKNNISIKGLDIKESYWKISKLSVVYHILNNPTDKLIRVDDFLEALEFYKEISKSFNLLLESKADTPQERLIKYILETEKEIIKMGDLRNKRFVNDTYFKKWFDEIIEDIQEELRINHNTTLIIEGKKIIKKNNPNLDDSLDELSEL